jgi:hypothetical protein
VPNWKDASRGRRGSPQAPSWLEILNAKTPIERESTDELNHFKPVRQRRSRVRTKPPQPTKPIPPPVLIDTVEGVYEPIFMYCDNCGQPMFRQFDMWHCWCGRAVENFASERHVKTLEGTTNDETPSN